MIITHIENAIIEAVKNANIVPEVHSYGGEFDDDIFEAVRRLPAVWATFGGAEEPKRFGARVWRYNAKFVTICAARSVKSQAAARQGDLPGDMGAYALIDAVHKILLLQDFGLPIEQLRPGAIKTLYNTRTRGEAMAVYTQEWHTAWVERTPPADGPMWLSTGLSYYLKPGDDNADASDVVTLQEAA